MERTPSAFLTSTLLSQTRRIAAVWLLATWTMLIVGVLSGATAPVDHSPWDRMLKKTVTEDGWVDYQSIQSQWQDTLAGYLQTLATTEVQDLSSQSAKKAFWINAYNAVTIQILVDEGLPDTVPHAVFWGKNIFRQKEYRIAGKVRSLDNIEHDILRKRYPDPRVHAVLVCGASSCPRLRPEAYTADKLDRQMTEEAQRWVREGRNKNGRRKNRLDQAERTYYVSAIFDWFEKDFYGGGQDGVLKFLKKYGSSENRQFLQSHDVNIEHIDYDWSLNSQHP